MKIHLRDSNERRHYLIRRLDAIDTKIDTFYTGTFNALDEKKTNPHKHTFLEIMFIDNGSGTIEIDGVPYKAQKDDIVIYLPNKLHKEYSDLGNTIHAYFFGVKFTDSLKHMVDGSHPPFILPSKDEAPFFLRSFKMLIDESKNIGEPYSDKITNCLAKTIVLKILQMCTNEKEVTRSDDFIKQVQNYLDEHYLEDISLNDYYETLPFSKFYIAKLFKSYLGVTPLNYITSKRMNKARDLLNTTDKKIIEIASDVGYKDIYYFTKVFKKEIGVSPSAYRKRKH